jgi:hypothetical protein
VGVVDTWLTNCGDRPMSLNDVTHEKYLDKLVEKLTQVVAEIQILRRDTDAIRRLLNEITEKRVNT